MNELDAVALGTLLARHPVGWWLAGMALAALAGLGCLAGLRALRRAGPPLRRLVPHSALGARGLLLGAMAACAGLVLLAGAALAALAESGQGGGRWGLLDDTLAATLRTQAATGVLRWFGTLTHLGDSAALTVLALGVAGVLWQGRHRLLATGWLAALAGNAVLTRLLKELFERVRPEHVHGLAPVQGYGFPSGHSSAAMVAYVLLAYLATRLLPPRWHVPAAMLAGALVFTTGWSRVVLHVHYASDVLAGWLLGAVWMACAVLAMESVLRLRPARRIGG